MAHQSSGSQIYVYSLILLLLLPLSAFAQSFHTESKKAVRSFATALEYYDNGRLDLALSAVNKALSFDDTFLDAILLKAELSVALNNDSVAVSCYERLLSFDSLAFPRASLSLCRLYMKKELYEKTIMLSKWFLSLDSQSESSRKTAESLLETAAFRKEAVSCPVDFEPVNIGGFVNTAADEYVNHLTSDASNILFTRHVNDSVVAESLYISRCVDGVWLPAEPFLSCYASNGDMGGVSMNEDRNVIYFSGCGWHDGRGSCDIYMSEWNDDAWSLPVNVATVNTSGWESQPCLSNDGKELYFVRRSAVNGKSDIYVTFLQDDDKWSTPKKLNNNINTDGNEMAPFLHSDGNTLFFSSDGHVGMGGYDIFMSRRDSLGEWGMAHNMGYPLNTAGDEINMVVAADARQAFISSRREEGYGGYDIYAFELDDVLRPEPVDIDTTIENLYKTALSRGDNAILQNIYFEFDSAVLDTSSMAGIDAIVRFLSSDPQMRILVIGHTDNIGEEEYNMSLSERRAAAVRDALIKKGIAPQRLEITGEGSSSPLLPNDTEHHRALNRRIEIRKL